MGCSVDSFWMECVCDELVDTDECAEVDKGGCDQICMNTGGSYVCVCREGFSLDVLNYKTCRGVSTYFCLHFMSVFIFHKATGQTKNRLYRGV